MLSVEVSNEQWIASLKDDQQNQIPFAMKTGLNMLGQNVQDAERSHMRDIFTERRPEWMDRSVKITHFATKTEQWVTLGIHPPGGDDRADIITKFEDETGKAPVGSSQSIAIPIDVRRNKRDIVPDSQRPRALMGNPKVYVIRKANGVGLIVQRLSTMADRVLYLLVPRVRITPDLAFEDTAMKTIDARWEAAFDLGWYEALKTAK